MTEAEIQAETMLQCGALPGVRLFRNHVGQGWHGKKVADGPGPFMLERGDVVIRGARRVSFGLHPGSGDLIGWHRGRFLSLEIKTPQGHVDDEQKVWLRAVSASGGLGLIIRNPAEAVLQLTRENNSMR